MSKNKIDNAKEALRKHLLKNKDRIKGELDELRAKSEGKDIDWYVKQFNKHNE